MAARRRGGAQAATFAQPRRAAAPARTTAAAAVRASATRHAGARGTTPRAAGVAARNTTMAQSAAVSAHGVMNASTTVHVELGDRSYPIYIGRGLLDHSELLRKHIPGKSALIVTNETIAPLYLGRCLQSVTRDGVKAEVVVLPDGEQHKSLEVLQRVWDRALECRCVCACNPGAARWTCVASIALSTLGPCCARLLNALCLCHQA